MKNSLAPPELAYSNYNKHSFLFFLPVIALAIILRLLFYTGFFGTDEVTYTQSAVKILNGDWSVVDYIGAIRYGINIPVAFLMSIFGTGEYSANLWSFLCSIGEIALIFFLANRIWGLRAAFFASLLLTFLPLHVHYAGRLMADAPLAFFITLSFVLFWLAENKNSPLLYIGAGLSIGTVFWIKESPLVFSIVFAIYAIYCWRWNKYWLLVILAAFIPVIAQMCLMWALTGNPLHLFVVMTNPEYNSQLIHSDIKTSPLYYIKYLLIDIKHTWLLGYFIIAGLASWARQKKTKQRGIDTDFVVVWLLGLLGVFTFTPMSAHPFTLVMKQTNYMLIFMAPAALLSGWWLSKLKTSLATILASLFVAGSIVLSGLEQLTIETFTANSKATDKFAASHPSAPVYAFSNGYRASIFRRLVTGNNQNAVQSISSLIDNHSIDKSTLSENISAGMAGYVIIDLQTIELANVPIKSLKDVPSCWVKSGILEPEQPHSAGLAINQAILSISNILPGSLASKIESVFMPLSFPKPAYVYAIPTNCEYRQSS